MTDSPADPTLATPPTGWWNAEPQPRSQGGMAASLSPWPLEIAWIRRSCGHWSCPRRLIERGSKGSSRWISLPAMLRALIRGR